MAKLATSNLFADLRAEDSDASSDEEGGAPKVVIKKQTTPVVPAPDTTVTRGAGGARRSGRAQEEGYTAPRGGETSPFRGGENRSRGRGGRGGGNSSSWENNHPSDEENRTQEFRGEGKNFRNERARGGRGGGGRSGGDYERVDGYGGRGGGERSGRGRGGRDFDRHYAGADRGRGMKKGGGGAHNWGNQPQDFGGEQKEGMGSASGGWADDKSPSQEGIKHEGNADLIEKEEAISETPSVSYEDYLKERAEKRANLPTLKSKETPSATNRSDLEKEGLTIHVKDIHEDSKLGAQTAAALMGDDVAGDYYHGKGVRERDPTALPIGAEIIDDLGPMLNQDRSRSMGRGGRGGGRGRGRGGDRGDRGDRSGGDRDRTEKRTYEPRSIDLGDAHAFPCLG